MRYVLATLALLSFASTSHARNFGDGWDSMNGAQRRNDIVAYIESAKLVCPKPPAEYGAREVQEQFLASPLVTWGLAKGYADTFCSVRVATVQASAHAAHKPRTASRKPPVVVVAKTNTKEEVRWPLAPWPEVPQPVEPQKETRIQMLIRWAQELWYWQTTKPAS